MRSPDVSEPRTPIPLLPRPLDKCQPVRVLNPENPLTPTSLLSTGIEHTESPSLSLTKGSLLLHMSADSVVVLGEPHDLGVTISCQMATYFSL